MCLMTFRFNRPPSLTLFFFRGTSRNTSQRITSAFLSVMTSRNICLLASLLHRLNPFRVNLAFVRMGLKGRQAGSHLHSFITSALSEWICVRVTPTHVTNAFNITRKAQKWGPGLHQALRGIWISNCRSPCLQMSDQCFASPQRDARL